MRAKDFFQAVREAKREVNAVCRKRDQYQEMARSITGMSETNIRSVSGRSRTESAAIRLVEIEDKIGEASERYVDLIEKAERVLREMKTQRYRDVLNYRYMLGMSWRSVADEMDYHDVRSAYRVHGWALAAAQRILDKMDDM